MPTLVQGAFPTVWPAIVISAWYGGFGPGLVCTALSVTGAYLVLFGVGPPLHVAVAWFGSFLVSGALISWGMAALHRRNAELADSTRTLQREISRRAQSETDLQQAAEFATRLATSSPDGILAFDRDCRYRFWNPAMERITGLAAAETLGKCAFDVFPFLRDTGGDRLFRRALAGHSTSELPDPYSVPGSGEQGFYEWYSAPLRDSAGTIVGGLAIVRDVSARVRPSTPSCDRRRRCRQCSTRPRWPSLPSRQMGTCSSGMQRPNGCSVGAPTR